MRKLELELTCACSSGSSSLPAHQTWINLEFVVAVVNYALKQFMGTNKALRLHKGKLQ